VIAITGQLDHFPDVWPTAQVEPLFRQQNDLNPKHQEREMSLANRAKNKLQSLAGRAREELGRATGNRRMQRRGITDQMRSDLKDVGEQFKETFGSRPPRDRRPR
jgi:uncharacterized protein YjbJ (UPF0337 family)